MTREWIGFRLDVEPPCEPLLLGRLAAWLEQRQTEGTLRRWFFLWYSYGGFHLRLRLHSARGQDAEHLAAGLRELGSNSEPSFRLRRQLYDRNKLAFGETRESVLAELLHVATSQLALGLLSTYGGDRTHSQRWLLTSAAIAVLLSRSIPEQGLHEALDSWIAFAARTADSFGVDVHARREDRRERIEALSGLVPQMRSALETHSAAGKAVALLRRLRQRGELGRFVATHALHLFCNEMGLWIELEHDIAATLRALTLGEQRRSPDMGTLAIGGRR